MNQDAKPTFTVLALLAIVLASSCHRSDSRDWRERLTKAELILDEPGTTLEERFYALPDAAKAAYETGAFESAERYAQELLDLAPQLRDDWNYGNAIHDGHMVLGRLAARRDDMAAAIEHLAKAGDSPGSPQLNSFGPNMSLANDLLKRGERDAVLRYFEQCRRFWSLGTEKLDSWAALVEQQQRPAFGANLVH